MDAQKEITIYSCITNNRDTIKPVFKKENYSYVMFTDLVSDHPDWEIRPLQFKEKCPILTARLHKHLPHILFPNKEITLWIDGTHWIYNPIDSLLDLVKTSSIAASNHFLRKTIKEEIEVCILDKMDDLNSLQNQKQFYQKELFPDNLGLIETCYLLRANNQNTKELQELWVEQILKFSKRDQISLPYCLWKLNMNISIIPGQCRFGKNDFFKMRPHRNRGNITLI